MITYTLYTPPSPPTVTASIRQAVDKVVKGGLSLVEGPSTPLQLPQSNSGDVITLEQKQNGLNIVNRLIAHKKFDRPQFAARYGKTVQELCFEDLLFLTEVVTDIGSIHFTRAQHNHSFIIPFNIRAIHVGQFINAKRNNTALGRILMDPYAVGFQISRDEVKRRYGTHPSYDMVMEAFGKDAEF